ncbi:TetR family transcriptional regulator [Spirillospora sp. NPDC000708]
MSADSAARGQQTRARLLDAAVQLIVEEGWGAATTRKIADRAQVRPGVVHYHFGSVTDLLVEASLDAVRRELDQMLVLFSESRTAPVGLGDMLTMIAGYPSDDPLTVLMTEAVLAATRIERLRTELAVLLGRWRSATAKWLEEQGVEDAEATATVMGAVLDGLVLHYMLDPGLRSTALTVPIMRMAGLTPDKSDPVDAT